MDRLSMLAGLLYLTGSNENKDTAIQLLNGDLSLKSAQQMPQIAIFLKDFDVIYKDGIDQETQRKIMNFVEDFLFEVV